MERQTKHRILGILVVLGLIVIMLPFFQTSNELPSATALIKAPPFPDQAVSVSSSEPASAPSSSVDTVATPEPVATQPDSTTVSNEPLTLAPDSMTLVTPVSSDSDATQPDDTINLDQSPRPIPEVPPVLPNIGEQPVDAIAPNNAVPEGDVTKDSAEHADETPALPENAKPVKPDADASAGEANNNTKKHAKSVSRTRVKHPTPQVKQVSNKHRSISGYEVVDPADVMPAGEDGFVKLKTAAWAVQVGTFKNKANATRLVNLLRKKGYPSFTQEAASNKMTKVLVGPESKHPNAKLLAAKVENDVHVRGIVVSYKPLAM